MNQVIQNHGVHNLEKKQSKLKINYSNRNDIVTIIGPPSTKSSFNDDIYIYIERKTSSSRLTKLGKKVLLTNNVLILEIDNNGVLKSKKFYNKEDMNNIKFDNTMTGVNFTKRSFIYKVLTTVRQKIDDPLDKKRIKN